MKTALKSYFRGIYLSHKNFWNREVAGSLVSGGLIFLFAVLVQTLADSYVEKVRGVAVGDLLLDRLPTLDLDFFIVEGALILTLLVIILLGVKPRYLVFSIKAIALFVIVRSVSITLTHLGQDPNQLQLDTDSIGYGLYNVLFNSKNDFFFSGHTGMPFLMALIFWHEKFWRYLFIIFTVVLAASVLFAHIHYSIDVFAAPFIVYCIFQITRWLFPKDYARISKKI